jgi:hypothetical protein
MYFNTKLHFKKGYVIQNFKQFCKECVMLYAIYRIFSLSQKLFGKPIYQIIHCYFITTISVNVSVITVNSVQRFYYFLKVLCLLFN